MNRVSSLLGVVLIAFSGGGLAFELPAGGQVQPSQVATDPVSALQFPTSEIEFVARYGDLAKPIDRGVYVVFGVDGVSEIHRFGHQGLMNAIRVEQELRSRAIEKDQESPALSGGLDELSAWRKGVLTAIERENVKAGEKQGGQVNGGPCGPRNQGYTLGWLPWPGAQGYTYAWVDSVGLEIGSTGFALALAAEGASEYVDTDTASGYWLLAEAFASCGRETCAHTHWEVFTEFYSPGCGYRSRNAWGSF